ncbi:Cytidylate kinase [Candidatus Providencia siddallii]|uniref:Cytidylate kinase n=1 Tax=Candidatus Providencia siddallii TaxID=1715285 RepID=A0A0M6W890_9GAMM|nr:Cytidylate kinase [Candidatus Providencia siddallii]
MITIAHVIAIDGTSASGKGTICKTLANKLGWNFLDSGAIYRVLALAALQHNIDIKSEHSLANLAKNLNINFISKQDIFKVFLDNKDITNLIKTEEIGNLASKTAILPIVRKSLLVHQRSFRVSPGLIADGRDMGTVVFPDASVKIFLDASIQERTKRRMKQLQKKGLYVNFKQLLNKIQERDHRDQIRFFSPLIKDKNALILDSTNMSIEDVFKKIYTYIKKTLELS